MPVTPPERPLPHRAGIYCRLSYAPDGSLEKVERQEADCRALAERLGWPVSNDHIFPDNSRSAWQRNRKRPQWDRMLKAVDAGEIDAILVYHGDRLIRQPHDLEKLISIADQKGVRIASVSGTRDLDSPDDRFILRIEAAQACRESDNTSRRVHRALSARASKGLTQIGGRRPFGFGVQTGTRTKVNARTGEQTEVPVYDTTQQVPAEAKALADACDRLLAGQSINGVVAWLTEQGWTTTEGNPWTSKALKNILTTPRIAGMIQHEGELLPAAWDPIITRETWEDLTALLQRNAEQHPYQGRERRHLLTAIAECYQCEGVTVRCKPSGGRNRKHARLYFCPQCRGFGRNQAHLDRYVEGRTLRLLNDPRFLAELHQDDGQPQLAAEIATLERRKREVSAQLEELADHPDVDPVLAMKAVASYGRRIAELRARMGATADRRLLTRMVGITLEQWQEEPIDVRAATVRALWRIIIRPTTHRGPGFDTSAVELRRRPLPR